MNICEMKREYFIEKFSEMFKCNVFENTNILFSVSEYLTGLTACLMIQKQHFPEWWKFTSNDHLYLCEEIVKKIKDKRKKIHRDYLLPKQGDNA